MKIFVTCLIEQTNKGEVSLSLEVLMCPEAAHPRGYQPVEEE